jgi:peptidoglycan/LPS O-acetylase OafA/YrhL
MTSSNVIATANTPSLSDSMRCKLQALGAGRVWRALARNVFAIYVFHFPIVLLLQWALIDAPVPKFIRLLATVIGAIVGTFAFTDLIVLRLPFARRIF